VSLESSEQLQIGPFFRILRISHSGISLILRRGSIRLDTSDVDARLASLLRRMRPALVTLAETLISPAFRSEIDASDLVQQTLLEAHLDRKTLSNASEGQVLSWLRETLRHNVIDAARHLKSQKGDVRKKKRLEDLHSTVARIVDLLAADQSSPSQRVQREEQVARLLEAIQSLTEGQRRVVILKHLRGWTLKEISKELAQTETAVAGLLHRARQSLCSLLGELR
jgi:RNA polymerase sigma-70 factor (ECF subfamily)